MKRINVILAIILFLAIVAESRGQKLTGSNDFINQGIVLDIGKEFILVKNRNRINDGNIFVYDRSGKAIRRINRKGQGGGRIHKSLHRHFR